jgi:hypothetical protein
MTVSCPLRVLLVQLPLLDPDLTSARANVPLAAGYLTAFARPESGGQVVLDILPDPIASFGGDAALLGFILRGEYDVVGFTAYLWNLERSLDLARRIKRERETLVVMGGPEIVAGRRLLDNKAVDAFVCGEGEEVFTAILRLAVEGGPIPRLMPGRTDGSLNLIPNPYLAGALPVAAGVTLHLETMRGCSRGCRYCYYAKSRPTSRFFPRQCVADFFRLVTRRRAGEIYVMDPSLELRPDFNGFLSDLATWNPDRIPLHTELCLESVTDERAALLAGAGFVSVEAGLQSTNPRALAAVNRRWDRLRFERGAELLKSRGIAVRTGVILGLPEDRLGDFEATLGFVRDLGLDEGVEIYPLALLPGSDLAGRTEEFKIEAMPLPPYWVLSTGTLPFEDLFRAEEAVGRLLGKSLFVQTRPHFRSGEDEFIAFYQLACEADLARLTVARERIGNSLTLLVSDGLFRDQALLARLADEWRAHNPHTLLQIVVAAEGDIADEEARRVSDLFFEAGGLLERCHVFDDDVQGRFAVRLFALVDDPALAVRMLDRSSFIDPILRMRPGLAQRLSLGDQDYRPLLLIPEGFPADELHDLEKIYGDTPESLLQYGTARHE